MSREDYYNRMYDLFVALYKNARFSRPGCSMEFDEKNVSFIVKYALGDKIYVATIRPKMYRIGMSINTYRHEKDGTEVRLHSRCITSENCVFDMIVDVTDIIAEHIENDMLCCFNSRVLRPAIDNMQVNYWEMNQWREASLKDMVENIEEEEACMEVNE